MSSLRSRYRRLVSLPREHPDLSAIALITTLGLLLRAAFMFRLPVFYVVGSRPYYSTALEIVAGTDVTALSPRHTPGYPAFLVGVISLFGIDPQAIAAVQHLLGVVSAVLCYLIGKLVGGRIVGLAAGLMTALHGTLLIYEHSILTEPLFIFLALLATTVVTLAARHGAPGLFVVAGILIGIAAVTRPIGQAILLGVPPALLLFYGRWRPTLVFSILLIIGFGLGAGPWALRNVATHSEATVRHPGSTLLGTVMHERAYTRGFFMIGGADPDPLRAGARKIIERMSPDEPDPLEMWTEIQERLDVTPAMANKLMGEIALDTISRHPVHYAGVFARKIVNLFGLARDETLADFLPRTRSQWPGRFISDEIKSGQLPDLNPSVPTAAHHWESDRAAVIVDAFRPTQAAPILAVMFLIAVGSALLRPDRRLVLIPAFAMLAVLLINAIIAGDKPRYRYPLDPFFGIVGFTGLAMLTESILGLRRGLTALRSTRLSVPVNPD